MRIKEKLPKWLSEIIEQGYLFIIRRIFLLEIAWKARNTLGSWIQLVQLPKWKKEEICFLSDQL